MCGINGIVSTKKIDSRSIIEMLVNSSYRGPDDSLIFDGFDRWSNNLSSNKTKDKFSIINENLESNTWFGFNRLEIIDQNHLSMMPMKDKSINISILFNGEIYNYNELKSTYLKEELMETDSDSEVILKLYIKLGIDFINHLRGMFTIVLIEKNKIYIIRDQIGIKPLYYFLDKEIFVFASEIQSIFDSTLVPKNINYQGLAYSMYLGTCPAPLTIFENIYSLNPGHYIEFDTDTLELNINKYWELQKNNNKEEISQNEFLNDIQNVVNKTANSNLHQALMLSGGIDSTLLLALIDRNFDLNNFSVFHLQNNNIEETSNAKTTISKYKVKSHFIKPLIFDIENCSFEQEDPNTDIEATFLVAKEVKKEKIKILHSAIGMDELFGGYGYYKTIAKLNFLNIKIILKIIPKSMIPNKYKRFYDDLKKYGWLVFPFAQRSTFAWENIEIWLKENGKKNVQHPFEYLLENILISNSLFDKLSITKKISYLDFYYYISRHHTFRSEKSSMINTVELRFPFLDIDFASKYFNNSNTLDGIEYTLKNFLKNKISDIIEMKILFSSKMGFSADSKLNINDKSIENIKYKYKKLIDNNINDKQIKYLIYLEKILDKKI